ncbi:hypothetical protein [Rhizobium sp. FKL33]|uniref:hypothetical protein n=1 Tax=Rhizobium sp. FKL33 TaxID=2562307 RepID=UPI0010C100F8|nr:hypothetical protein [Rhizobium sp. FKL33]
MSDGQDKQDDLPDETPVVEWALAGISALLFASGFVYLVAHGVTSGDGPADLRIVHTLAPKDPHRVDFTIVNMGQKTAAQVQVKGQVLENGAVAEESRAVIDYAPEGSSEQGSLMFHRDIRGLEFRIVAEGFNEP